MVSVSILPVLNRCDQDNAKNTWIIIGFFLKAHRQVFFKS